MTPPRGALPAPGVLVAAGLAQADAEGWLAAWPAATPRLDPDGDAFGRFFRLSDALVGRLAARPRRSEREQAAAEAIQEAAREARRRFLRAHAEAVYARLTLDHGCFLRAEALVYEAAARFPGLTPTRPAVQAEAGLAQKDKDGVEIDQGIFLSHVLAQPRAGLHLCHAMLLPREESREHLPRYLAEGRVALAGARLERRGRVACLELTNPRYLNAEDDGTLGGTEVAVDLALLDPAAEVIVLRGGLVDHARYRGRRVFSSGINLTHLYHGRIPFVWYLERDLGLVNKIYRGVARPDVAPEEPGGTTEKPWIAAVEAFAIGGGCQLLLVTDHVLAEADAYLTLPARKEGIIPGAANLRLPRLTGDRIARQAIQLERRLVADSPEGRLIVDEVVPPGEMDAAIERLVAALTGAGVVSAASNRRALRAGQEPLDLFRRYMAVYAHDQAYCHFSSALIRNLERHWDAARRTP
jgi:thioesterase DpgC